jgi:ATP-binding cassette subfamily C protein CydD
MVNRKLLKEALSFKYYLPAIIVLEIMIALSAIFQAVTLSFIINKAFMYKLPLSKLQDQILLLLLLIIFRAFLTWGFELLTKLTATKIKFKMREKLQKSLLSANPLKLQSESSGEIVNLAIEGVERLDSYFSEYLPQLAIFIITPLLIIIFSFQVDITSSIIMLITAPLIPFFMILIGKYTGKLTSRQWETLSRLGGHFLDIVRGLPTLKLFGRSKTQRNVIHRVSENFRKSTMDVLKVAFLSSLVLELLATLSTAIIAVTLGIRLIYSHISFENALFLLILLPEFYQPLRQLGAKFHSGLEGDAAANNIFRFFSIYPPRAFKVQFAKKGIFFSKLLTITFCDVSFRYDDKNTFAVNNVSFTMKKGFCTVVTGESGSGKSTLASLLLGFIHPDSGKIFVNNVNLQDIPYHSWRRKISYVPQHPYLFCGSIVENIRLGKPDATEEELLVAAKLAGIHDFITSLPLSYNTNLEENGKGLSSGQKQRIAIARAFLKNSLILIMDEPASSLDIETEESISQAIKELKKDKFVLLITHSPNLISIADEVYTMNSK